MIKLRICTMAACALFAAPAFSQAVPGWDEGVAAAVGNGWWGRETARGNRLLNMFDGADAVVASADFNPQSAATAQSVIEMQDGDDMRAGGGAPLSDGHWEYANMEVSHQMADLNGDGHVSRSELIGMLEGGKLRMADAAPQPESVSAELGRGLFRSNPMSAVSARRTARFEQADADGDGRVGVTELMQMRSGRGIPQARAQRLIARIDTDGDMRVSLQELSVARGQRFMKRLDVDGDGQISAEEWAVTLE